MKIQEKQKIGISKFINFTGRMIILMAVCLSISACSNANTQNSADAEAGGVEAHGQLMVKDGQLCDSKGLPFQLEGISTHGIAWFPEYVSQESFSSLAEMGANAVRLAMYTDTYNGYIANPEGNLNLLYTGIDAAIENDMYVVADWHILDDGDPGKYQNQAIDFFAGLSDQYAGDPHLIFEICNEPNGEEVDWAKIKAYAEAVIPAIRANSPEALIIVGTPEYSYRIMEAAEDPLDFDNVMYSFHYYAGQHINFRPLMNAVEAGFPAIVSEWGVNYGMDGQPAIAEGQEFMDYMNENQVSYFVWSLCNKDEVFSLLKPECIKLSDWTEDDMTEPGKLVFCEIKGR